MSVIARSNFEVAAAIDAGETLIELDHTADWQRFELFDARPSSDVVILGQRNPETGELLTRFKDGFKIRSCLNINLSFVWFTFTAADYNFGHQVGSVEDSTACTVSNCWAQGDAHPNGEVPSKGSFPNIPWGIGLQLKNCQDCVIKECVTRDFWTGGSINGSDRCLFEGVWAFGQGNDNFRHVDSITSGFRKCVMGPGTGRFDLPHHPDSVHVWNDKKAGGRACDGLILEGNWFINEPGQAKPLTNGMLQLYHTQDDEYPRPSGWRIIENVIFNDRSTGFKIWPNIDGIIRDNTLIPWPPRPLSSYEILDEEGEPTGEYDVVEYKNNTPKLSVRKAPKVDGTPDEENKGCRNVTLQNNVVPIQTFQTVPPNETVVVVSEHVIPPEDLPEYMHIGDSPWDCYFYSSNGPMGAPSLMEGNESLRPQLPLFMRKLEEEIDPVDPEAALAELRLAVDAHQVEGQALLAAIDHLGGLDVSTQINVADWGRKR